MNLPWRNLSLDILLLLSLAVSSCCFSPPQQPTRNPFVSVTIALSAATSPSEEENSDESLKDANEIAAFWKPQSGQKRKMKLMWCTEEFCKDVVRERVVGRKHNRIVLSGPATGQVVYHWDDQDDHAAVADAAAADPKQKLPYQQIDEEQTTSAAPIEGPNIFLLVKAGDDDLMKAAAEAVQELCAANVNILLDPATAARIKYNHGVDDKRIHLYEAKQTPGFGDNLRHEHMNHPEVEDDESEWAPDLICTLGGDGLLMYAGMMFQGPVPPILCVAGGSLGFLTPFSIDEMVEAILTSLGKVQSPELSESPSASSTFQDSDIEGFPPNMSQHPYSSPLKSLKQRHKSMLQHTGPVPTSPLPVGLGNQICLSIRMRLECSILTKDGTVRTRYNVLNEVAVDRGISPYLAALECFCDDVHLTTVQADGVIFATPTGSTAYALAAGSSVVHPSVPCILVTPICPHVLSFRPMIFPDHVVLRCYVPEDARAEASVAFDGKHRQELRRGHALEIKMSPYAVPTINRVDQSSDWLGNLKRNFNFNSRPRQRPL